MVDGGEEVLVWEVVGGEDRDAESSLFVIGVEVVPCLGAAREFESFGFVGVCES